MQLSELSSLSRASEPDLMPFIDLETGNPAEDENGDQIVFHVVGVKSKQFHDGQTEIARIESEGDKLEDSQKHALLAAYCTVGYTGCIEVGDNPLDLSDKRGFADMLLSDPDYQLLNQILVAAGKKQTRLISQPSSTDTENLPGSKQRQTKTGNPETKVGAKRGRPKKSQS